jgi:hypothetical protein
LLTRCSRGELARRNADSCVLSDEGSQFLAPQGYLPEGERIIRHLGQVQTTVIANFIEPGQLVAVLGCKSPAVLSQ